MPKRIEVEKDNFYALVSKKEQSEDEMKPEGWIKFEFVRSLNILRFLKI